jgi:hypothetical protein
VTRGGDRREVLGKQGCPNRGRDKSQVVTVVMHDASMTNLNLNLNFFFPSCHHSCPLLGCSLSVS